MPVNTSPSPSASTENARPAGAAAGAPVKMESGGAAAAAPAAPPAASSGPGASSSSRSAGSNPSGASWKNESEETVKTRKNALRVIVTKFRNFWPTEDDTKLTSRATLLEKGVFDVTSNKQDYIQKLQRDLNVLSQKKESEKKHAKQLIQTSGDLYAAQSGKEASAALYSADAKAKFLQRLHSMERKHQQMLMLLKTPDDRPSAAKGTETQIKQIVASFRQLSQQKDAGPFDVEQLNRIDDQLEKYRLTMSRARPTPNREGVEKQNDRTLQVGSRMMEKLRRLNKDRPFVVTELAWSMEDDLPDLGPPPELLCLGPSKREAPAVYAQERKPKIRRLADPPPGVHPDGAEPPALRRVCPYRSPGGDCVPCVRESFMEAPSLPPAFRTKGFLDADNPNDTGEQAEHLGLAEALVPMPLSVEAAYEQLKFAAMTFSHPDFEPPEPVIESGIFGAVSSDSCFVFRTREETWGWDGELTIHSVTVKIVRDAFPEDLLPWDCRVVCLRRLPVHLEIAPETKLDGYALCLTVAKGHFLSPADWLVELLRGARSHLRALNTVWVELRALRDLYPGLLSVAVRECNDGSASLGVEVKCCLGGQDDLGCCLDMTVPVTYPREQPSINLSRASTGVASGRSFEHKFRALMDNSPSPLTITELSKYFLEVVGQMIVDEFRSFP